MNCSNLFNRFSTTAPEQPGVTRRLLLAKALLTVVLISTSLIGTAKACRSIDASHCHSSVLNNGFSDEMNSVDAELEEGSSSNFNSKAESAKEETPVPPNNSPVGEDDHIYYTEGQTITFNAFADNGNGIDYDPDGDPIEVLPSTGVAPSNGSVVINQDGTISYTPDAEFTGIDTFTYFLSDIPTSGEPSISSSDLSIIESS
ncbi:MAG: Ig-like domain-containing protein, partial [Flavobacteriales bacterium]